MATSKRIEDIVAAARQRMQQREVEKLVGKMNANDTAAAKAGNLSAMQWGIKSQGATWEASKATSNIVQADKMKLVLSSMVDNQTTSTMTFNPEQLAAIELGLQGKNLCLIGAAGTGKTTVTQELISRVQRAAHMLPLAASTKHLRADAPGIVICGYTNKAVNNIRKKLPPLLQSHCITIHKLLEYAPVYYEVPDPYNKDGIVNTMRFEPTRNATNPLPHISTIIFEESSMIGTDLHDQVLDALPFPARTQFIYLGDLNQLPPVFGPSILGFKLAELRTIELKHVYRQALLSPIISIATAVRTNQVQKAGFNPHQKAWHELEDMKLPTNLTEKIVLDRGEHGKLTLHPWKKRVDYLNATNMMKSFLPAAIQSGNYDPEKDMILCPFNKSFGTIELNNIIADYLAKQRGEVVHEVIARFQTTYWAVGDRVMHDRHEAVITKIYPTPGYSGKPAQIASKTLNRWGRDPENKNSVVSRTADEILNALDTMAGDTEASKNLASHTIHIHIPDLDKEEVLNTAGSINQLIFGYALTIHKSQGSEWERVFLFLHNTHATMLSRELIYTGITRAKHELYIICEADLGIYANSLVRAAERPIIPGTKLEEKIAYFKGKGKELGRTTERDDEAMV